MRDTDERVLGAIRSAWAEQGFAPTIHEIGERIGVTGSATIQASVMRLIRAGAVTRAAGVARTIRLVAQ